MDWLKRFFFWFDIIGYIKDFLEVIRDKDERILLKILLVIISCISIFVSVKVLL